MITGSLSVSTAEIESERMRATVEKLASWPNRNTNNPTLTEAAHWVAEQFRGIAGLEVELMTYTLPAGPRVPEEKQVVQVVAKLPGTDPTLKEHLIVMGGHLDTINMASADVSLPAPGANDDASGVAATLECARVLSASPPKRSVLFVAFSGEEQGLVGSGALAKRAKAEGWKIDAVLSNDMIANSQNNRGDRETNAVRVFSEQTETHNSRELARWMEWKQRQDEPAHRINLVFRRDRFGRGGDHTPFNREGFTAIRVVEQHEEYARQHTDQDLPRFMDWAYLAANARLNLRMIQSLANAAASPAAVRVSPRQSYDAQVSWTGNEDAEYDVYWRLTTDAAWRGVKRVKGLRVTMPQHKDDHVFAVGAVGGIPIEAR